VYVFLIGSLFKRADQFAFDLLDRRSHMNFFFINIYGSPLILFLLIFILVSNILLYTNKNNSIHNFLYNY
jgi:hypothetical protein